MGRLKAKEQPHSLEALGEVGGEGSGGQTREERSASISYQSSSWERVQDQHTSHLYCTHTGDHVLCRVRT